MTPEEMKEYHRNYYLKNKELIKENSKNYYYQNIEKKKDYGKSYREKNKELIKQKVKVSRKINRESLKLKEKQYRERNKEYQKEYSKAYRQKNKEIRNYKERERNQKDPLYKLSNNIRRAIRDSFKRNGYKKNSNTHKILDCTFEQFKIHLESKFESWMTWNNYGLYNGQPEYGWDIDHIIPSSSSITEEDVIRLNHYSNLQPLCSHYNRDIKKNKI